MPDNLTWSQTMPLPASNHNTRTDAATDHLQARFSVESRVGLRERPDGGLFLDASRIDLGDEAVALALVADLSGLDGGRNCGNSATNAMGTILTNYCEEVVRTLSVKAIIWVELDSMGCFDIVFCPPTGNLAELDWTPLLSGAHDGRTEADFVAMFGPVAQRAMANVRRAVRSTPSQ
jgi:hypothetical protein